MKPVSICIPAYKATHFKECLTSAIAQTYQTIEIIVSDDCPNDDIRCICEQFNGQLKTDLLDLQQQIDELPFAAWRRWKIKLD